MYHAQQYLITIPYLQPIIYTVTVDYVDVPFDFSLVIRTSCGRFRRNLHTSLTQYAANELRNFSELFIHRVSLFPSDEVV